MFHNGFAARWGGEEFLLVFDSMNIEQAHESLEELLDKIRALETHYGEQTIQVTMTFGLTAGDSPDYAQLLRAADEKLYEGKASGRNKIVL